VLHSGVYFALSTVVLPVAGERPNVSSTETMDADYPRGQEAVQQLNEALLSETDRGKALMAGAFLDAELDLLLRSVTVQDKKVAKEFFRASGVLGTFSSRIDAVYLLGLISKAEHRDLHLIRKIRNDFGHTATPLDFNSPAIRDRCLQLHHHLCPPDWPVSERFMHAVMHVVGIIHAQILEAKAPEPLPDKEGYSEERMQQVFGQAALDAARDAQQSE
jgi:DNA-binding MltR family transcriptional regulator